MTSDGKQRGVLMVCLGNICRSPIAESVFREEVRKRGSEDRWFIDSAATSGWHTGSLAERRARNLMRDHSLKDDHKARTLDSSDFTRFHFIFGMDYANVNDIKREAPANSSAVIEMLGVYDPVTQDEIRDPYYDKGSDGFVECYERCVRAVNAFLDKHDKQG